MSTTRETLDVDVLFVGGGPAGLAGALHLAGLSRLNDGGREAPHIMIIEKSAEVGHHLLSGAVLDPVALRELAPDFIERGCPVEATVSEDGLYFLSEGGAYALPIHPPGMDNRGLYVISICRLARWLAGLAEAAGVSIVTGFPGASLLWEGEPGKGWIAGVRTGDKGIDRGGNRKPNCEPGVDIRAKVTVLCEGTRGSLTKTLTAQAGLDQRRFPQVFATAVKEVWKLPEGRLAAGRVIHTLGWPLDSRTFGGGFVYGMSGGHAAVGFVAGCDAEDPAHEPYRDLQAFRRHPMIAGLLEGGERVAYGAKSIPEGGWYAIPRPYADGVLIAGDAAGFLNAQRLKGIHLAMKTGMLAAETAFEALKTGDATAKTLAGFERRIRESWVHDELWRARNFRQAYAGGLWKGMLHTALQTLTGGRGVFDPFPILPGHERMKKRVGAQHAAPLPEGGRTSPVPVAASDKRTDVYYSGTTHEENQPCHLVVADTDICRTRCAEEYGNPCRYFCPANVYEMVNDEGGEGKIRLQINAGNCVHCKTCDIMDPYQIITWVVPEGGGGPRWTNM
jgi:electron-transferring-flavoprotein dehydrogenase